MKGLFGFLVFAMVLVCLSYADAQELKTAQNDTANPTKPTVVMVVDRNPKVQTLQIIENGALTNTFPISTGRETFDFNEGNYKINPYCSFTQTNEEYAKEKELKTTPDFKVQLLREMNVSDTWSSRDDKGNITSKTRMPHALFFNGGTAFHAVDIDTAYGKTALTKLGPKESAANGGSGACVRLSPENAKFVFDLVATKKDGAYNKADPRQWKDCQVAVGQSMSHKCSDPEQWPVVRNKNVDVQIKITDSRTPEEQAAARKACYDIKNAFLADKAKCLESKVRGTNTQAVAPSAPPRNKDLNLFQKIGNFFSGKKQQEAGEARAAAVNTTFDFKKEWAAVSPDLQVKYNEECNREGHQKIKSKKTPVAPKIATATPPLPPKRETVAAVVPPKKETVPVALPPKNVAPETKTPKASGLWLDYSGR